MAIAKRMTAGLNAMVRDTPGPPTTSTWSVGDLVCDGDGVYWVCTAAGTPGTWTELGSVTGVPVGGIIALATGTAPSGYMKCNGAAVSRTTYDQLFLAIGTTFGVGDGSTTFNLPDLRGEFIRGHDDGRGLDSGRALGSSQGFAVQNATGSVGSLVTAARNLYVNGSGVFATGSSNNGAASGTSGSYGGAGTLTLNLSRQMQTAAETRPRNIALTYVIKY